MRRSKTVIYAYIPIGVSVAQHHGYLMVSPLKVGPRRQCDAAGESDRRGGHTSPLLTVRAARLKSGRALQQR